jgi:hypothetical protein
MWLIVTKYCYTTHTVMFNSNIINYKNTMGFSSLISTRQAISYKLVSPLLSYKSSITYSECVFIALFIQHAERIRSIILSSVDSLALPYFFTLSHNLIPRGNKRLFNKKCIFSFATTFLKHFAL